MLLLCNPHNPVGRVWTEKELIRIWRICIDNDVLIVADEIHFDLIMPGYKHTVFANISEEFAQHSITCTAPSKTFNLAGMQTSNIIISNSELRDKFVEENKNIVIKADQKIEAIASGIKAGKYPKEGLNFLYHLAGLFGPPLLPPLLHKE
jgi:bifunctional pyridoxal-dependent enzyme with beta-cystathionase and maltose regulon repressor activities